MNKFIMTDGQKSLNLLHSDDPSVWTYFSNPPQGDDAIYYSKVSAVFRAYNLKATTVSTMPFALYKGAQEYDNSATWENKVGFLPNPSELFRLDTLSYIASNAVYNLVTSDAVGFKARGLYNLVPATVNPITDPQATYIDHFERGVGGMIEKYDPKTGKQIGGRNRLIYMLRLDHTTELLPSRNTEAQAIANAAGVAYFADSWVKHFFERGGVAPTVIAMKGAVTPSKRDDEENSWKNWVLGLGKRFRWNPTRVVNADTLDVKQFGSSVTELKDNGVYQQALANIAMGTGMPLSLLLANSANYATAKEEKATWYESDIIPFCNWLAYEYNHQLFEPLGLRLEFHPETLDPQQEDETQRAQAFSTYMDAMSKCPTYDLFVGWCETMGLEISEKLDAAAQKFYSDKEAEAERMRQQTQPATVTTETPQEQDAPMEQEDTPDDAQEDMQEDDTEEEDAPPAKFVPSLDQARELQRWQELAFRKFKRGEGMPTDWRNDTLPEDVYKSIVTALTTATSEMWIKAAFDVAQYAEPESIKVDGGILELAKALNNLAESIYAKPLPENN